MLLRSILLAASLAAGSLFTASTASAASEGWATGNVNLRSCASTRCRVLTTIPAGARVWVYNCGGWCELQYRGIHGFASARYISVGGWQQPAPPVYRPPLPPTIYWNFGRPWWDDRHGSWYDGRRWWYDDGWHHRPRRRDRGGVFFEFGF